MSDIEALARYAQRADAEAFKHLVSQYQGLVFSACRRILGDAGEVEDAVQETFIKLARQAGCIHSNPASWIFTCALNTARDKRRADQARRERETAWVGTNCPGANDAHGWQDLLPVIDDCIAALPDEERELLVQSYLLHRTQEDLAAERGISRPTLRKRLDEGVGLLREGLRRRGVAVSIVILAGWLTEGAAEAAVPAALGQSLAKIGLAGIGRTASAPAATSTASISALKAAWTTLVGSAVVRVLVAVIVCAGLLAGIVLARQRLLPAAEGDAQQVSGPNPQAAGVPVPAGGPPDPAAQRREIVVVRRQTTEGANQLRQVLSELGAHRQALHTYRARYRFEEYLALGDIPFLVKATLREYSSGEPAELRHEVILEVETDSIEVNKPVKEEDFQVHLPAGTRLRDTREGVELKEKQDP